MVTFRKVSTLILDPGPKLFVVLISKICPGPGLLKNRGRGRNTSLIKLELFDGSTCDLRQKTVISLINCDKSRLFELGKANIWLTCWNPAFVSLTFNSSRTNVFDPAGSNFTSKALSIVIWPLLRSHLPQAS